MRQVLGLLMLLTAPLAGWLAVRTAPGTPVGGWVSAGVCGFVAVFCLVVGWQMMSTADQAADD